MTASGDRLYNMEWVVANQPQPPPHRVHVWPYLILAMIVGGMAGALTDGLW